MNKWFAIAALIVLLAAGGFYLWQRQPMLKVGEAINAPVGTSANGRFVSTYVPQDWKITENDAVATSVQSPGYATAPSTGAHCADAGGGDCSPTLTQGAQFTVAYDPCVYSESAADFRKREAQNSKTLAGLVEQKPITVAGHDGVLFHTRNLSNTARPVMIDQYTLTLIGSAQACQDVNFQFAKSTSTDYEAEFAKFLAGLKFEETANQ